MRKFALPHRPSLAELRRDLPGARVIPFQFNDLSGASIAALCAFPEAMLDAELRRQNSFFGRLEREHLGQLETGLTTLRSWLDSGQHPEQEHAEARGRLGDGTVIAWQATPDLQTQVVYVDYDLIVLAHARALLDSSEAGATEYIEADLRDTGTVPAQAVGLLDSASR